MCGLGCKSGEGHKLIPFEQPLRARVSTKSNFYTLHDNAIIGFANHSKVPLGFAALGGFSLGIVSLLGASVFSLKLLDWDNSLKGMEPLLLAVLFFSSVQLFSIGIIGEDLVVILTQVLKYLLVIEKERINF